jgi:methylase of polypeptide subunit release factors
MFIISIPKACASGFHAEISPNDKMFIRPDHYVKVGLSALSLIDHATRKGFTATGGPRTILDLPCGYGRVTRALRCRFPKVDLTVCDIDQDAVNFCAEKFQVTGIYGTDNFEKMEIGKTFDLI